MYLRLGDLRGFEELMIDFAEEPPELQMLIDIVLRVQPAARSNASSDDRTGPRSSTSATTWACRPALAISPETVAEVPQALLQADLRPVPRRRGTSVYMHTDGHILPDHPRPDRVRRERGQPADPRQRPGHLVRECKGKVCVDLDLDRQLFPFCTPAEIDAHVRECVEALGARRAACGSKAEMGPDVPLENIEAICAALEKYRGYFS